MAENAIGPHRGLNSTGESAGLCLQRLLPVPEMACPPLPGNWCVNEGTKAISLTAQCNGTIRLGGVFEAFFETYWTRHTTIRTIEFACDVAGTGRITILRRDARSGAEAMIATRDWQDGQPDAVRLPITLATDGESYLVVDIAAEWGASITNAHWTTTTTPSCVPRIGVAITTFNRDEFVTKNLALLTGSLGATDSVVVVNHGAPGLEKRLAATRPADPRIRIIDQENSGGAGGFTRGMRELKRASEATHIVLMDDDIDIPPDLIDRLRGLLAFTAGSICIGGAMFDYNMRTRLFTQGDIMVPGSLWIGHIVPSTGCDVSRDEGVDFMARAHQPDFNGWWCFALPVAAIDSVGWPLPCFIRGDDVEYGYRLKQAGWPTIGWPGIAVWHLPFVGKSAPWHMFYDRRNTLFTNAIHRRISRWRALAEIGSAFVYHYLRYDYDRVRAMTLGIEAYCRGARAMQAWAHRDHAWLIARTTPAPPFDPAECELIELCRLPRPAVVRRLVLRIFRDLYWPWRVQGPVRFAPGTRWRPDYTWRPARVLEMSEDGEVRRAYCYSWSKAWVGLCRFGFALLLLAVRFEQDAPIDRDR